MGDVYFYQAMFAIAGAFLVIFWFTVVAGRTLFPTATTLFFLWQTAAYYGTLTLMTSENVETAFLRLTQMLVGLSLFVLGALIANGIRSFNPRVAIARFREGTLYDDLHSALFWVAVIGISLASILVGVIFVRNLGSSVLVSTLGDYLSSGALSSSGQTYRSARSTVHGTEGVYLAAGYTVQFICILLPLTLYLVYARYLVLRKRIDRNLLFVLAPLTLFFLTAPGNRSYILSFFLTLLLLSSGRFGPLGRYTRLTWYALATAIGGVSLVILITALANRAGVGTTVGAAWNASIVDLIDRTFLVTSRNQLQFLAGYRPILLRNGQGWLASLSVLLPGPSRGSSLASELARLFSGNASGSAPPDFWTSIYWNFDTLGIIIVPFLTGFALQWLSIAFFTGKRTLTHVVVLYVSFFAVREIAEPIDYFNFGFATIMIFYVLTRLVKTFDRRVANYDREIKQGQPEVKSKLPEIRAREGLSP